MYPTRAGAGQRRGHAGPDAGVRVGTAWAGVLGTVVLLVGCGSAGPAATPQPPMVQAAARCGSAAASTYSHVVWVVFENAGYDQVLAPGAAPYLQSLAAGCGLATDFHAETHPSLPNYLAMTSGATQGVGDDAGPASHQLAAANLFGQLGADWRALQESMPAPCSRADRHPYAVKHNPPAYYTGLRASCPTQDVPLTGAPDLSARFTFITPNLCNDGHDCGLARADGWASRWLPAVFGSPQYRSGSTVVFLTWDEDEGSGANHVATVVAAPTVPAGARVGTRYDHYAMLRTTEELLGLPDRLGGAGRAPSMRAAFHL